MWTRATDLSGVRWRTSSYTNGGSDPQCVELACLDDSGAIRDSKNPSGPALIFPKGAFQAFIAYAGRGDIDRA